MKEIKNILVIFVVGVIAVIDIGIYWNNHLYYQAIEKIKDSERKIRILEKANNFYPSNDLVYYELGKAYFDLSTDSLTDVKLKDTYLRKSLQNFTRSIKINPVSFYSHYNFAQSLRYMSYVAPSFEVDYYDEYKKAAVLAGHNSEVFYNVGKIFLSRWLVLSDKDKEFTIEVLKKILSSGEKKRLQDIMHTWEMNVKDYDVLDKIIPRNPRAYNLYAQFLGEKSLSLERRQNLLAQAEFMEFERAKNAYNLGLREFQYFRIQESKKHFSLSLDILKKLKFYQDLTNQKQIDPSDFKNLLKSVYLKIIQCNIEEGKGLKEVEDYVRSYLNLEDKVTLITELESYLKEKEIIPDKLENSFDDLNLLSFKILLNFEQKLYRDIIGAGRLLQESFVVIPETEKEKYVKVLHCVGDSYQKVDYIYEASEFYQKALEIDPYNLESLLKYRQNRERLNYVEEIQRIDERIEKIISPREIVMGNSILAKGQKFSNTLTLDARTITLDLHISNNTPEIIPLISVFFNGRVIWEDYLKEKTISLLVDSQLGKNNLVIVPINRPVNLLKIIYE